MEQDKKKIAKNSLMLFIRMGITVVVALFTSRIVLQQLGISDFGIYNVVGGVVSLMTFVNGSLIHGIQRYLNYYKATQDNSSMVKVFSASIIIVIFLGLTILFIGETVGLWFVNNYLVIPPERLFATNWVYQLSLLGCVIGLIQIPFTASIVAYEDMQIYAYIALVEVGLKLMVIGLLCVVWANKLILYAILMTIVIAIITTIYIVYGKKKYPICRFRLIKDKKIYKDLLSFSGWTVFGTTANLLSIQGINIILNLFFGPAVNAARGIAVQVSTQLDNLINNVQVAMNPQLIQLYAKNQLEKMHGLLIDNFKWNFFLFWICGLPILYNTEGILRLWLGEVPDYTIIFTQLVIIRCFLKVFERPLITATMAFGKMKLPSLTSGVILIAEVIVTLILFKMNYPPYWAYLVDLIGITCCIAYDLWFLQSNKVFPTSFFFKRLWCVPVIMVLSCILGTILNFTFGDNSPLILVSRVVMTMMLIGVTIFFFGFNGQQRKTLIEKISSRIK